MHCAASSRLLENGDVLQLCYNDEIDPATGKGSGREIRRYGWDNNLAWVRHGVQGKKRYFFGALGRRNSALGAKALFRFRGVRHYSILLRAWQQRCAFHFGKSLDLRSLLSKHFAETTRPRLWGVGENFSNQISDDIISVM